MPRAKSPERKWMDIERSALRRLQREVFDGKPNDLKNLAISAGVATDKISKIRAEPRQRKVASWDDRDTADALLYRLAALLGYQVSPIGDNGALLPHLEQAGTGRDSATS